VFGCSISGSNRARMGGWLALLLALSVTCTVVNAGSSSQAAASDAPQAGLSSPTYSSPACTAYQETRELDHLRPHGVRRDIGIRFDQISLNEGLSQSLIMFIVQDSTRFISPAEGYVPLTLPWPAGFLAVADLSVR